MDLRNIAIIAHVDHGKTTLVDELLKQSGAFRENQAVAERAMDSNDLERERGITIFAKPTSVEWKDTRINIVDTPGHADFGGEVERILSMVDGVVLLVDAAEGPMPQTKFVTSKALALGLRPIVVLNKVDKPDAEPDRALDEVFDLFSSLDANEDQLDFPHMYASGRSGWADHELDGPRKDLHALFDLIVNHVPEPKQVKQQDDDFRMLATTLGSDPFMGRTLTGRVESGKIAVGATVQAISRIGQKIEQFRVTKIQAFRGLQNADIEEATAGDIVTLAGMSKATVADTICALAVEEPLDAQPIDPPTITVTFGINDSPLAGRDGKKVQSRVIRDRLYKEAESNVAIKIEDTPGGEAFEVSGRGELQMGVLIENMRREGFELSISRPQVIMKEEDGQRIEPAHHIRRQTWPSGHRQQHRACQTGPHQGSAPATPRIRLFQWCFCHLCPLHVPSRSTPVALVIKANPPRPAPSNIAAIIRQAVDKSSRSTPYRQSLALCGRSSLVFKEKSRQSAGRKIAF